MKEKLRTGNSRFWFRDLDFVRESEEDVGGGGGGYLLLLLLLLLLFDCLICVLHPIIQSKHEHRFVAF